MLFRFLFAIALFAPIFAADGAIALQPYPQKIRTEYSLSDSRVPEALRADPPALPTGGIKDLAIASDGATWYATASAVVRVDPKGAAEDRVQYFSGRRYLPSGDVRRITPDQNGGLWVRTESGVSHIEFKSMTLAQKAAFFEERIRARHDRHGFVSSSSLKIPGDLSSNYTHDTDNDGLWTAMYAAAECFRYSKTKSPEALANAQKAIDAVLFLEEVTGRPGYPARTYIKKGEPMPKHGEWHWTADGKYYWKSDTSSDEIVGHYFIYSIAYDLLPDEKLKKRIAATARRITDHILANNYYLIDVDGKPTLWGKWSLEYFKERPSDSSLNALELLSLLKVTHHVTGDARYDKEYRKAAVDLGYARIMTTVKQTRDEINYSDEELAMLSFYPLFRHEKDSELLNRYYRPALDQWWENISREQSPLWALIYLAGRPDAKVDLQGAVRTLYRTPMDLLNWGTKNSDRSDVTMASKLDRFRRPEAITLLPPDERPVMKWNGNPFVIDSTGQGNSEDDGAAFLLPYWLGRFMKIFNGE